MEKRHLTGQILSRVFNFRNGCLYDIYVCYLEAKLSSLKLKIWPKQLLGYLLLEIVLHSRVI